MKNKTNKQTKNDGVALCAKAGLTCAQWLSFFPCPFFAHANHTRKHEHNELHADTFARACPQRHAYANWPSKSANKMAVRHSCECAGLMKRSETIECVSGTGAWSRLPWMKPTLSLLSINCHQMAERRVDFFLFLNVFFCFRSLAWFQQYFRTRNKEKQGRRPALCGDFTQNECLSYPQQPVQQQLLHTTQWQLPKTQVLHSHDHENLINNNNNNNNNKQTKKRQCIKSENHTWWADYAEKSPCTCGYRSGWTLPPQVENLLCSSCLLFQTCQL